VSYQSRLSCELERLALTVILKERSEAARLDGSESVHPSFEALRLTG